MCTGKEDKEEVVSVSTHKNRGIKRKQVSVGDKDDKMKDDDTEKVRKPPRVKTVPRNAKLRCNKKIDKNKGKKKVTATRAVKKKHPTLRIRTSPNTLCRAVHELSTAQRKCVIEMGFGKMLAFNIDVLPSKLVYHVVNCFDDKKMVLRVGDRGVEVTSQVVHEVLGIPWGGLRLQSMKVENGDGSVVDAWRQLNGGKDVTPVELKDRIVKEQSGDWNFKINFLVLFANIMGGTIERGRCDLSLLKHIGENTDVKKFDWCLFLLETMLGCKKKMEARSQ